MLFSILWILIMGFFAGQLARRLTAPPLIGMILVGIILGPQVRNLISQDVLGAADELRTVAVTIILMKAGLGLDREKLAQQGSVALRLGFLPATTEAIAIAIASIIIFKFDFPTGLLLGCVIGAESPAVIVPGMLRLKSLGLGVTKGIPDAILTGSALSDVLLLLVFSLLLNFLSDGGVEQITLIGGFTLNAVYLLPIQILMQIVLGLFLGYLAARLLVLLLTKQNWTQNAVQDTVIAASLALFLVIIANTLPYFSGYLATMAMGFFLIELDAPLARRLRGGFDSLWVVAEIFLFVLLGATIQLQVLENILLPGILILSIGLFIGRMIGWYLSTLGSNWNWHERLFLLPGNSAKATVQAAIGAIPLAQGIAGGEIILAIAVLSILITAPLGAWATTVFAPKLLRRGEVDPTKVTIATRTLLLAAVDTSSLAIEVLTKVADLARRSNGEAIVLHVVNTSNQQDVEQIQAQAKQLLSDIRYKFLTITGAVPEEILRIAETYNATAIVMGKRGHQPWEKVLIGSVSQAVIENSSIPVILLDTRPKKN
ncbi:sodium/proton antiporter, CPA1 family [Trichormus variabilis ATCC 29413]|uniref:Sodium/proton antiporter, CPA1 family n=2 Tax=Anabaena variabilis TaxID=264691 RepID=Q3MH21_TRIV2|nr:MULTISPECIES: cation:proton antiporter [Nostocaceae]ABA19715.1 sodium/proton antiporter, CPA1 family [Trichormus variabilis ATCC 29413]MBC1213288.1 cation:proton antiporter [Trichormus variabilis ARAD]MBC1254319.1 cation:proton antiporter [Trichormus variabilis V5]MBC1267532.1 cation:proton antiporter [Trichormus variabilis FSR]MBC1304234.1 cation:proton antiporter [Trichormus variabilis N2B]